MDINNLNILKKTNDLGLKNSTDSIQADNNELKQDLITRDSFSSYDKNYYIGFKGNEKPEPQTQEEREAILRSLTYESFSGEEKIFTDGWTIKKITEDKDKYDRAIELVKLTCADVNGKERKIFIDGWEIAQIAEDKDKYDRAIELVKLTYTDENGKEQKIYTNGWKIAQIAEDKDKYDRVIELVKLTYTDKNGKEQKIFTNDEAITKIAENDKLFATDDNGNVSLDKDFKERYIELAKLTYTDKNGKEQKIFTRDWTIKKIAENDKLFTTDDNGKVSLDKDFKERYIELAKLTYTDYDGKERKLFIDGWKIEEIAEDKDKYDRTIALVGLTYTDKNGNERKIFTYTKEITEIAEDDEIYERVVALAGLTYTDYDGKERKIFTDSWTIPKIAKDKDKYDRVIELVKLTYTDKNGKEQKIFNKANIIIIIKNNKLESVLGVLNALKHKKDINEISISDKKKMVKYLVGSNSSLFNLSEEIKNTYPLIPLNQEEYCSLLPKLIQATGIETRELSDDKINKAYSDIKGLSEALKSLSDDEFNNLEISQEYSKNDFINDVLKEIESLDDSEKAKVFDYYGFELEKYTKQKGNDNDKNNTGYTIIGYPVNLNNGKKLAKIENEKTKEVIENLRPYVIKLSENNKVQSNNIEIEKYLNEIINIFPELRTTIGKAQHKVQDFDVMKHSLKVMQKIVQNPEFDKLNDDDKKVMLLASLLHDITKKEGNTDGNHDEESSFDSYFITKKLKLSRQQETKLYTLIKRHEWLKYLNNKEIDEQEKEKRLKSVAFDMQYDSYFKLAKIFTCADIQAITKDNRYFDIHKPAFKDLSKKVDNYILELKSTKPMLPTTEVPKASRIKEAITKVNSDGSTNIKGVYIINDLVTIKFNEVEDWEVIGFPKGTISKGITLNNEDWKKQGFDNPDSDDLKINTGNIKFIAHGLDYENQLFNFDAFSFPDSDALLSVSYMERPESKFRLFRTQGVLLDTDFEYVYGGGNTDSGSGCGKNIEEFKLNYAFEGSRRYEDRTYISNIIKKALNLNDKEYVKFIKENGNKKLNEIEPKETREKLIRAFATITSRTRHGERSYNEMYISNPKRVCATFAYPEDTNSKIGNINKFIKNQPEFLKKYSIEHDVPMIVFGD